MAKYESIHPDKIPATLEKDEAIRGMFMNYLIVEEDSKIVSFKVFSEAIIRTSTDESFKQYAQEFKSKETITTEDAQIFYRRMLSHETSSHL